MPRKKPTRGRKSWPLPPRQAPPPRIQRATVPCSSGKLAYSTEVDGLLAVARVQHKEKDGHSEKRVYRCPECRLWHATSRRR